MDNLRERVARQVSPQAFIWGATPAQQAWAYEAADAILALMQADEAAIRADERAKVREAAQSDEAVKCGVDGYDEARRTAFGRINEPAMSDENKRNIAPMIRAAILAALGDET